ncbi:MAG: flagellar hook-basal body complex protein FliE [Qingshengfaniella sp.]
MQVPSTLAALTYERARAATEPQAIAPGALGQAAGMADDFAESLRQAEVTAQATMNGKGDTNSMVMALAQSQLAIETVVTVRDKVVEAYQEILRMPV